MAHTSTRTKSNNRGSEEIRRIWGDLEVVDAETDLRVFIAPDDVDQATEKDPGACVFAQACRRCFGSTKVLFFRTIAYLELPTDKGIRRVERFMITKEMRELIEAFDKGEGIIPEGGFSLRAMTPGRRLEHMRLTKRARGARERLRGEREVKQRHGNQGIGAYADEPIVVDLAVRSGSGAVHFTVKP